MRRAVIRTDEEMRRLLADAMGGARAFMAGALTVLRDDTHMVRYLLERLRGDPTVVERLNDCLRARIGYGFDDYERLSGDEHRDELWVSAADGHGQEKANVLVALTRPNGRFDFADTDTMYRWLQSVEEQLGAVREAVIDCLMVSQVPLQGTDALDTPAWLLTGWGVWRIDDGSGEDLPHLLRRMLGPYAYSVRKRAERVWEEWEQEMFAAPQVEYRETDTGGVLGVHRESHLVLVLDMLRALGLMERLRQELLACCQREGFSTSKRSPYSPMRYLHRLLEHLPLPARVGRVRPQIACARAQAAWDCLTRVAKEMLMSFLQLPREPWGILLTRHGRIVSIQHQHGSGGTDSGEADWLVELRRCVREMGEIDPLVLSTRESYMWELRGLSRVLDGWKEHLAEQLREVRAFAVLPRGSAPMGSYSLTLEGGKDDRYLMATLPIRIAPVATLDQGGRRWEAPERVRFSISALMAVELVYDASMQDLRTPVYYPRAIRLVNQGGEPIRTPHTMGDGRLCTGTMFRPIIRDGSDLVALRDQVQTLLSCVNLGSLARSVDSVERRWAPFYNPRRHGFTLSGAGWEASDMVTADGADGGDGEEEEQVQGWGDEEDGEEREEQPALGWRVVP